MNKKIIWGTIVSLLLAATSLLGQSFAPVGTAVAQFLEVGMGARASGLGEAYTAVTRDAGSVFWNPAGLAEVESRNLFSTYTKWLADIAFTGAAFAMRVKNLGTFAVSTQYLMTGDMEVTTVYQPDGTGEKFSLNNICIGLSYARFLTDRFSIGMTGKMVREKYWSYEYDSWALDIGTLYRTGFHGMRLGMSILHFGPEVRFSGSYIDYSDIRSRDADKPKSFETYSLPVNFRFGVSLDLYNSEQHRLLTAADMTHSNNNIEQYNWGFEYGFHQLFFIRGGYKFTVDEGGLALGTGFAYTTSGQTRIGVDYAYSDYGVLKDIHRISFSLVF